MASAQHDICAICLEQPKNPKSLPTCTHLFCEACLNTYVRRHQAEESITCPTCTIACPVQDIIVDMVEASDDSELVEELTQKELCTFCSYKGLEAEAEFFCDRCDHGEDVFLCRDCATSHGKRPQFKDHEVKPLSAFIKLMRCKKHMGRVLKHLCMGCDAPACDICVAMAHDDHELVDISDAKEQLSNCIKPLQDAAKRMPSLQQEVQDTQKAEESVITLVERQAEVIKNDLVNQVDKRRDELLSAVHARAQARSKQVCVEMASLSDDLQESLKHGRDIFSKDITNAEHYRMTLNTTETLAKTRLDTDESIFQFEKQLGDAPAPRFVPKEGTMIGEIEYLQRKKTGTVRLELGGKYVRKPCYKIAKAVPYLREDTLDKGLLLTPPLTPSDQGPPTTSEQMALLENCNQQCLSLKMTGHGEGMVSPGTYCTPVDIITGNSGKILSLLCSSKNYYMQTVKPYGFQGSANSLGQFELPLKSFAQTKSGQYVLLTQRPYCNTTVHILDATYQVKWPPLKVTGDLGMSSSDLKILCPESTDLLLIYDGRGEKVSAVSLAVKQDQMIDEAVGVLRRYFAERVPILPPVRGFYILDISCDEGKVYLCIKKGAHTERSPEAGPIQFYQATYTYDKWQYTAIPLEDPTGKPFSELKKDEMLQLGAHRGTLMCLVYSPIPLAELKESKEPGMNITWYHGKLP